MLAINIGTIKPITSSNNDWDTLFENSYGLVVKGSRVKM